MTDTTNNIAAPESDAAAIIASTRELAVIATSYDVIAEGVRERVVPTGWHVHLVDDEELLDAPRRKSGSVLVTTAESLAQYVNVHRTDGTTLYANPDALEVEAVIDDHDTAGPHHRDHRALLKLTRTPACLRWYGAHGRYHDQESFAQLIEDGITEIARPTGAELLELAQSMHATNNAAFRSSIRLDNGETRFSYVEELEARAGADGSMTIPSTITLVFAPFYGADDVQIEARLRYRLSGGKLALGVWLIRGDEAIRAAFDAELVELERLTNTVTANGLRALWGVS